MKALFVGGKLNGITMDIEDIISKGYWNGKITMDWSVERASGGFVCREELDNQPLVDGYLSPMWDGGHLRYETFEVYAMMSRRFLKANYQMATNVDEMSNS